MANLVRDDGDIAVWWGTWIECAVAVCLQLASALRWCEGDTTDAGFVCLDDRLRRAAQDEGFGVLPGSMAAG